MSEEKGIVSDLLLQLAQPYFYPSAPVRRFLCPHVTRTLASTAPEKKTLADALCNRFKIMEGRRVLSTVSVQEVVWQQDEFSLDIVFFLAGRNLTERRPHTETSILSLFFPDSPLTFISKKTRRTVDAWKMLQEAEEASLVETIARADHPKNSVADARKPASSFRAFRGPLGEPRLLRTIRDMVVSGEVRHNPRAPGAYLPDEEKEQGSGLDLSGYFETDDDDLRDRARRSEQLMALSPELQTMLAQLSGPVMTSDDEISLAMARLAGPTFDADE